VYTGSGSVYIGNGPAYIGNGPYGGSGLSSSYRGVNLYNSTPLVEYKKEGDWIYYKEYNYSKRKLPGSMENMLVINYRHFGQDLSNSVMLFDNLKMNFGYDSIRVKYADNNLRDFYGYGTSDFVHLQIRYYEPKEIPPTVYLPYPITQSSSAYQNTEQTSPIVKECGQLNPANEKIGVWKHFSVKRELYKTENFLVAWKEDDE
jgi:hypothetical protein